MDVKVSSYSALFTQAVAIVVLLHVWWRGQEEVWFNNQELNFSKCRNLWLKRVKYRIQPSKQSRYIKLKSVNFIETLKLYKKTRTSQWKTYSWLGTAAKISMGFNYVFFLRLCTSQIDVYVKVSQWAHGIISAHICILYSCSCLCSQPWILKFQQIRQNNRSIYSINWIYGTTVYYIDFIWWI